MLKHQTLQELIYGSVACDYWREKIHVIWAGLPFDKEAPSIQDGLEQNDKAEDRWVVLDVKKTEKQMIKDGIDPVEMKKQQRLLIADNNQLESAAYLDEEEDHRGYSKKDKQG